MKTKMVTHAKLQYYRHNYCLVCMTGMLGCRWHRYKQSTRDSRKRDLFWFTLFTLTFLFIVFYLYFWLVAKNDYDDINSHMFTLIKTWIPWYRILLGLVCATFSYFIIFMVLCLCHILHGHQLFMHPVHIVLTVLTLTWCIAITVAVDMEWSSEWGTLLLSLQVTGPFLQIGAVVLMTSMTWIISLQWYKLPNCGLKVFWLLLYSAVMIGLYISPLYINSPCVISVTDIPPKPKLVAHRGASGVMPENTVIAFQYARNQGAYAFETDVRISWDGVPFLMHDKRLRRTTNVEDLFPDKADMDASFFNSSQLRMLNAGSWFLQIDPMWTVGDLSDGEKQQINNQSVAFLEDVARIAARAGIFLVFDVDQPPKSHPFYNSSVNQTLQVIKNAGLGLNKIWWLENTVNRSRPSGVLLTAEKYHLVSEMRAENMTIANVHYTEMSRSQMEEYKNANISVNVWTVNSKWFYSLYWCMGISSVSTNWCQTLEDLDAPVWHLAPTSYLILWVTVDVLSAVIVITLFIVQRIRLYGTSFSPETISLNTPRSQKAYRSRTMKEKLLYNMTDGVPDAFDDLETRGSTGVLNQPASSYSMASITAEGFSGNYGDRPITQPDIKYEVE